MLLLLEGLTVVRLASVVHHLRWLGHDHVLHWVAIVQVRSHVLYDLDAATHPREDTASVEKGAQVTEAHRKRGLTTRVKLGRLNENVIEADNMRTLHPAIICNDLPSDS